MISFTIPIRTKPGLNGREHWRARAARVKRERDSGRLFFLESVGWRPWMNPAALPVTVRLIRISPGTRPMDDDNLPGSMKAIRDGIADALEVDDGDANSVRWEYGQERGPWGVRVELEGYERLTSNVIRERR